MAIFLLLFNPRFICFAYAGGVIATFSLVIRFLHPYWPALGEVGFLRGIAQIHLPGLLALIGVLHLTESLLIYLSGHLGYSPIYLKTPDGEVVGGYSLQRFWPLPLAGLWAQVVAESADILIGGIPMPDWWPLLGEVLSPGRGEQIVYLLVPLVAGLGYSDLALSSYPQAKRKKTAGNLALYSILLLALAVIAAFRPEVLLPAALFAPLGHELVIKKGNKEEFAGRPLFRADFQNGLKVLAIFPGSPAQKAGVEVGDRLLEVSGDSLNSESEFGHIIRLHHHHLLFKIERDGREIDLPVHLGALPASRVGLIFAPTRWAGTFVEIKQSSFWRNLLRRLSRGR